MPDLGQQYGHLLLALWVSLNLLGLLALALHMSYLSTVPTLGGLPFWPRILLLTEALLEGREPLSQLSHSSHQGCHWVYYPSWHHVPEPGSTS